MKGNIMFFTAKKQILSKQTRLLVAGLAILSLSALLAVGCGASSASSGPGLGSSTPGSVVNVRNEAGIVSAASVLAQAPIQNADSGEFTPYIAVRGISSIDVEPNRAVIALSVETRNDEVAAATSEVTTAKDAIIAALDDIDGVGSFESSISIRQDFVWNERQGRSEPNGFIVSYTIRFEILGGGDIDLGETAGEALAAAVNAGGDLLRIDNVNFTLTSAVLETHSAMARRQAAVNARTRANDYAEALGVTTGRVLTISEDVAAQPVPLFAGATASLDAATVTESARVGGFSLEQGLVTVSAAVSVVFGIQ